MQSSYVRIYNNINCARETVLLLDKEMPLTVPVTEKTYRQIQEQLKESRGKLYEFDRKRQYDHSRKWEKEEENIAFLSGYPALVFQDMIRSQGYLVKGSPVGENDRICIVNSADRRMPGGDFLDGSAGQEGYLCRNTTLFHGLTHLTAAEDYYERGIGLVNGNTYDNKADVLYIDKVIAIRDMMGNISVNPRSFSVITAAPINNYDMVRRHFDMKMNHIDFIIRRCMLDLLRNVINAAIEEQVDHLIFSSFGTSGGHDPVLVAQLLREILYDEIVYDAQGQECRKKEFFRSIAFITPDLDEGMTYQQIFKYDERLFPDGDRLYYY